jgi:hypothetical protein
VLNGDEIEERSPAANPVNMPGYGWTSAKSCATQECESCNTAAQERSKAIPLALLHKRLGHFDCEMLRKMVQNKAIDFQLSDTVACNCDICRATKVHRTPVPKQREEEAAETKPFERVWTDVKGKLLKDWWGNQYMVTFTDEVTRWTCVYFCQKKSQVKERFQEFLKFVEGQGYKVKVLCSDGGGEYTASEHAQIASAFEKLCEDANIRQKITSPDTSAQNGISERLNRKLIEHAKAEVSPSSFNEQGIWLRQLAIGFFS